MMITPHIQWSKLQLNIFTVSGDAKTTTHRIQCCGDVKATTNYTHSMFVTETLYHL
jgi:hypothetical protein